MNFKDGKTAKVVFWDTAGQEMYKALSRIHYKDSDGAIAIFDLTRRETFDNIEDWLEELKNNNAKCIPVMLVGNKLDIVEKDPKKRQVGKEEAKVLAKIDFFSYKEVSAITSENLDSCVQELLRGVRKKMKGANEIQDSSVSLSVRPRGNTNVSRKEYLEKQEGGCC